MASHWIGRWELILVQRLTPQLTGPVLAGVSHRQLRTCDVRLKLRICRPRRRHARRTVHGWLIWQRIINKPVVFVNWRLVMRLISVVAVSPMRTISRCLPLRPCSIASIATVLGLGHRALAQVETNHVRSDTGSSLRGTNIKSHRMADRIRFDSWI